MTWLSWTDHFYSFKSKAKLVSWQIFQNCQNILLADLTQYFASVNQTLNSNNRKKKYLQFCNVLQHHIWKSSFKENKAQIFKQEYLTLFCFHFIPKCGFTCKLKVSEYNRSI